MLGILLSKIKVEPTGIKTAIEALDENTLSLEDTRALLRLAPSPEEVYSFACLSDDTS